MYVGELAHVCMCRGQRLTLTSSSILIFEIEGSFVNQHL